MRREALDTNAPAVGLDVSVETLLTRSVLVFYVLFVYNDDTTVCLCEGASV